MILQPTNDNIVLKLPKIEKEKKTNSGIIMLQVGTQQSLRTDIAEVVATGEGRRLNNGELLPLTVKEGNQVLFNKYAGTEVIIEDEKYLVIKENDILAIVK